MANTFSQMYVHVVFAVQHRAALIDASWEEHLYKYITGIVQCKGQKMLAINGMPDHIHLLIGVKPDCRLSDLVREIKKSSHDFINESHFLKVKFNWQTGFGAFTYGQSQIDGVIHYVMNQKSHHTKTTFREEYLNLLRKFGVEFNEKYLFEWI